MEAPVRGIDIDRRAFVKPTAMPQADGIFSFPLAALEAVKWCMDIIIVMTFNE